jgi:hypothetical protein
MLLKKKNFSCVICQEIAKYPVECIFCHNLFCKRCADKSIEKKKECPLCLYPIFSFVPNAGLNNLIDLTMKKCENCNEEFTIQKLKEHKMFCREIKCKICDGIFENELKFINHFDENTHKEFLIEKLNLINNNEDFFQKSEKEISQLKKERKAIEDIYKKIKKEQNNNKEEGKAFENSSQAYPFLNLLERAKNDSEFTSTKINQDEVISSKTIEINPPDDKMLNEFMHLYYCGKKTNFNCGCEIHYCEPSLCLCPNCMTLNKQYHLLKHYNLINCAGRATRCFNGKFVCYCKYKKKIKKNNNFFINENICKFDSICDACTHLNQNIKHYFSEEDLKKLNIGDDSNVE